jgi:hypothetical protein
LGDLVAFAPLVMRLKSRYTPTMTAVEEIKKQALALGIEARVHLVESLLSSLPSPAEEWSEVEELAEAERREREIETGQVQALHDGEFWERIEARRRK